MAENDQLSQNNLIESDHAESVTIPQPSAGEPLDVESPEVAIGWAETESESVLVGNATEAPGETARPSYWPQAEPGSEPDRRSGVDRRSSGAEARSQTERRSGSERRSGKDRRSEPRFAKPHLFVTCCHWAMVVLLVLSFISGARITWSYLESGWYGWGLLDAISPKGALWGKNLVMLHILLSFFVIGVAGVYALYLFQSGASRRMRMGKQTLQRLRQGAFVNGWRWNKSALWVGNQLVYWLGFIFVAVFVLTGIALYQVDWGLTVMFGGYETTRWLHSFLAYLLLPYTVLHMLLQWSFGRFWTIFRAQFYAPHIRAGLNGLAIFFPIAMAYYVASEIPTSLNAKLIPPTMQAPQLDGDASDPVWKHADALTVRTVKGVNNPKDHVDVKLQALHDGKFIYFKFEWDDPDASFKRFPLHKTADGWRVLETAKKWGDENVYYEDKFSMYVTDVPHGTCAATCHLGVGPHAARGQKHGLHYTTGKGEVGDVWHWKSIRTNYMHADPNEPGYMDDQHFRNLELPMPEDPKSRYKGGYHPDPKTGGGYAYNYKKLDKDKKDSEARVLPRFLPKTPLNLRADTDPTTSEEDYQWWLLKPHSVPYDKALDTEEAYPVGSVLPNIIIEPFEGDEADVRARAKWHQGRWTLEARRVLDTKSKYDVAFSTERPVYLSMGVYNRTQTRHTEQIKPVQLTLE